MTGCQRRRRAPGKKIRMIWIGLIGAVLLTALVQSGFFPVLTWDRTLNRSRITLEEGEHFYLRPLLSVNVRISYSSRDFKVARVYPNGKVEAVRPGRTVISVKINGKEHYCYVKVRRSRNK